MRNLRKRTTPRGPGRPTPPRASWTALLAACLAGCGSSGSPAGPDPFVPAPGPALAALSASLKAWQEGRPRESITATRPGVEVSDSYRTPDRPLRSFRVLGPVGAGEARGFAVRLVLDNPAEEQVVRYLVVGKDPLWVFRQEDYERIAHWEHKMEEDEGTGPETAPAPKTEPGPHHAAAAARADDARTP